MRILLSAFACQANEGSENGVGWNWAYRLARAGHEVWIITRSVSRDANERAKTAAGLADRMHFVYYDHPSFPRWFERTHLGYYTFCQTWQIGAYRIARQLHARESFDAVHHVTFATARFASLMGELRIPFTFGPVAGGERIPWRLRRTLPWPGRLRELVRDLSNHATRISPLTRRTFDVAERVFVTNRETLRLVPARHQAKCSVQLAIGIDTADDVRAPPLRPDHRFHALLVAALHARKGVHLALPAFARLRAVVPDAELTIVGDGPEAGRLRSLAASLGLHGAVSWQPWASRDKVLELYGAHDVFLFPSLRDSGGMVVLEALANGLPVICLDLGGPGVIVDTSCGFVVPTAGASEEQVIDGVAESLVMLARDPALRIRLQHGARARASDFTWDRVIRAAYPELPPAAREYHAQ